MFQMPFCSYCQRIERPDFWGGESELLVSLSYSHCLTLYLILLKKGITIVGGICGTKFVN